MSKNIRTSQDHALNAASWITRLAYVIAAIGTVASYGTQVALLLSYRVGGFSWVIPATIDLLAIAAAMALQLPSLDRTSRRIAGSILTVAVAVSVTANVTGAENTVAAAAHAWPVVAYLLGELLANRVRAYAARLADQAQAVTATQPAPAPVAATATVTQPATQQTGVITGAHLPRVSVSAMPAPAIAATSKPRRKTATATVAPLLKADGTPYSKRHARRLVNGK